MSKKFGLENLKENDLFRVLSEERRKILIGTGKDRLCGCVWH
jgi:hypothetical protein